MGVTGTGSVPFPEALGKGHVFRLHLGQTFRIIHLKNGRFFLAGCDELHQDLENVPVASCQWPH